MKYRCPCCGYDTFDRQLTGRYYICEICFWEYESNKLQNSTYEGEFNGVTLTQAQKNFKEFGACEREKLPYVRCATETESLIKYFYEELIMSLITMSLPAKEQKHMIGIGCVGDEILEDFNSFYIARREFYIAHKVFDVEQMKVLDEFDQFLRKYDGHDEDFYWDMKELEDNPLWEELRIESNAIIAAVFGQKYRIDFIRSDDFFDGMQIQSTKRTLIEITDFLC